MIKRKEGICSVCGKEGTLFRSSPKLCYYHALEYKKKKHLEKQKNKGKPFKVRKKTGEMDLFLEIWSERPRKSEVSGESLGNILKPIFFSHILTKGAYPGFRLNKKNIILMTPEEHQLWEFGKHKIKDKPEWKWVFELKDKLKREYYEKLDKKDFF